MFRHSRRLVSALGILLALVALMLAVTPWAGAGSPFLDGLAPAWPVAPALAVTALATVRVRSLAAVLALAALALCLPIILAVPRPSEGAGFRLTIVTHNVWARNVDPAGTAAALTHSGADLLLLQETNGRFAGMLPALRRAFPYANPCHHRCSLAILSRYPLDRVRYRFRDARGEPIGPGLIQTRVHLPDGVVVPVATIHLPRNEPPASDRLRRRALVKAARRADMRGLILAGDLNLVPWSARLQELDEGFAPVKRATAAFSWPARWAGRSFPAPLVPIDHLYAGPMWRVASVQQLPRTGSDHYPIRVELIWQGRQGYVNHPARAGMGTPDGFGD